MSERPMHRGGGRGGGGGNFRGGRGGGRGGGAHGPGGDKTGGDKGSERPKKENILDLAKYMDKQITVKFNGGREVTGTLKGYDALMNLVLDDVKETMRGTCRRLTHRTLCPCPALPPLPPFSLTHPSVIAATALADHSANPVCADPQTIKETSPPDPSAWSSPAAHSSSSSPPSTAAKSSPTPLPSPTTSLERGKEITSPPSLFFSTRAIRSSSGYRGSC
ncbi:U6 snRNP-associated protein Lsm7 [Purpureocillium takamizusanense]|uniref:U6 snRNP-associated protein Lsm7 n=1 Tax=Purpureocillium takamizusanense TaxID=2060973 RepID=A0A9Q8VEL2_9HYPO|nr:U6 snRNP-associated protein Lsm7 [Purpureocillium takamizusanense]UNI22431.1 U6 snRNP-associated protein Lsm7 [Purpureocillium takamizusanense]